MKTLITLLALSFSLQSFAAKVNEVGVQTLQMFAQNTAGLKAWKAKHKNSGPVIHEVSVRQLSEEVTSRYPDGEARSWLTKYEYVIDSDDSQGTDEVSGHVKWTVIEALDSFGEGYSSKFTNRYKVDNDYK